MTELNLTGRVAAVTGGGSGIGKAIARTFAAAGAQVRVVDIDGSAAATTADEIANAGGNALARTFRSAKRGMWSSAGRHSTR